MTKKEITKKLLKDETCEFCIYTYWANGHLAGPWDGVYKTLCCSRDGHKVRKFRVCTFFKKNHD